MGFSKILAAVGAVAGVMTLAGLANKPSSVYADEPDLKNPMERYLGIASLLGNEDPELYASSCEDEMKLFRYLEKIA